MPVRPSRLPQPPPRPQQPADLIREWSYWLRGFEPMAELDFSFAQNAITICDMRVPNALRYGTLYTGKEIADGVHKPAGDLERRVKAFMGTA